MIAIRGRHGLSKVTDSLRSLSQPLALHATAVAMGQWAILILGPSKAGKSRLALDLLSQRAAPAPVKLIGDDRVILEFRNGDYAVSPHPRIAGLIERRGHGLLAMPYVTDIPLGGAVLLPHGAGKGGLDLMGLDAIVPLLLLPRTGPWVSRARAVMDWYTAALAAHPGEKQHRRA